MTSVLRLLVVAMALVSHVAAAGHDQPRLQEHGIHARAPGDHKTFASCLQRLAGLDSVSIAAGHAVGHKDTALKLHLTLDFKIPNLYQFAHPPPLSNDDEAG